jgi:hypothetical protein
LLVFCDCELGMWFHPGRDWRRMGVICFKVCMSKCIHEMNEMNEVNFCLWIWEMHVIEQICDCQSYHKPSCLFESIWEERRQTNHQMTSKFERSLHLPCNMSFGRWYDNCFECHADLFTALHITCDVTCDMFNVFFHCWTFSISPICKWKFINKRFNQCQILSLYLIISVKFQDTAIVIAKSSFDHLAMSQNSSDKTETSRLSMFISAFSRSFLLVSPFSLSHPEEFRWDFSLFLPFMISIFPASFAHKQYYLHFLTFNSLAYLFGHLRSRPDSVWPMMVQWADWAG